MLATKTITTRVPERLHTAIKKLAVKDGRKLESVMCEALQAWLDKQSAKAA